MMEMAFPATSFFFFHSALRCLLSFLYCAMEMVLFGFFCLSCFHVPQGEQTGRPSYPASMDSPLP